MALDHTAKNYSFPIKAILLLILLLFIPGHVFAGRGINEVELREFKELGYKDKQLFVELYTVCAQVYQRLKKVPGCDNSCIKEHRDWRGNNCDRHDESLIFLLMSPSEKPASSLEKKYIDGYSDSYIANCLHGYPENREISLKQRKSICSCAAKKSLELISSDSYMRLITNSATNEDLWEIQMRSSHAKRICEEKNREK